jgi:hypothetical protein
MELLLPMAARKLDLSFDIGPDVPPCKLQLTVAAAISYISPGVTADYDRIRQGVTSTSI